MVTRIVIIGAGGFGREVLDIIEAVNESGGSLECLGFLDDGSPDEKLLSAYGARHLGPVSDLAKLDPDVGYLIGIGAPAPRAALDEFGLSLGRNSPVLVHPQASVGRREVHFGPGTIVCANASITNHITLGRHVHVNINSTIGHDARLDDYVTLSPLVAISGNVHAHTRAFFGTGAKVNPALSIGEGATVGTGAAVIKDVESGRTVVGVPARPLGG